MRTKALTLTVALFALSVVPSLAWDKTGHQAVAQIAAARLSPIVWYIHGRVTAQPWDKISGTSPVKKIKAGGEARLTSEEKRTIVEWIDTGAHR